MVAFLNGKADHASDVDIEDVIALTQKMVQIDSSNANMGSIPGPGETTLAKYIWAWLEHRNIEAHWIENTSGRPSIVGIVRGRAGGKSLMFNGHMDTVTCLGYDGDPRSGQIEDGNLYGRGAADMKSGLAAAMLAVYHASKSNLAGDVILAAVADEEDQSIGTEDVLRAGWRADAVIVAEPTGMDVINTHKGFALIEVDIIGKAAHGSRPDLGIDAISKAGHFLVGLERHAQVLQRPPNATGKIPETGLPSIHASIIKGGEEMASYPAKCTISIERRTVHGETDELIRAQMTEILENAANSVRDFMFDVRITFSRAPFFIAKDHPFVELVVSEISKASNGFPNIRGEPYWTDMALMAEKGIPGVICGPKGYGLHSKTEWVEVESVRQLTKAFKDVVTNFCG